MHKLLKTIAVMFLTALPACLAAAPIAYSINSDSATGNADGLYRIDLATGESTRIGTVPPIGLPRIDIEGLAFAPNGTLYGVDDDTLKLFPINPETASIVASGDVSIFGLPSGGQNDFGLTFGCDGTSYVSTVIERALYRIELDGQVHLIGDLGFNISAIAAYGNPTRLYGLGNGLDKNRDKDHPSLFEIDPLTGAATEIGSGLGTSVGDYTEGGLSFDDDGQLWAITDRAQLLTAFPSQVMKINTSTGLASDVKNTTEFGFESLAVSVPRGCSTTGGDENAQFTVQSSFTDGNNLSPVTLNIKCNTGLPLEQSLTVLPDAGATGDFEVNFVVKSFTDGALNCEVWQDTADGYSPEYDCQANNSCSTAEGAGPCKFEAVGSGETNLCLVQNSVEPVEFTVINEWLYAEENPDINDQIRVNLNCTNVVGGDGDYENGVMTWTWLYGGDVDRQTANLQPDFRGGTECWAEEEVFSSAIESDNGCAQRTTIEVNDPPRSCTIVNTVFYEGIPTLNRFGLIIFAALMLMTGLVASRRF